MSTKKRRKRRWKRKKRWNEEKERGFAYVCRALDTVDVVSYTSIGRIRHHNTIIRFALRKSRFIYNCNGCCTVYVLVF
jgi:hypothetical protein